MSDRSDPGQHDPRWRDYVTGLDRRSVLDAVGRVECHARCDGGWTLYVGGSRVAAAVPCPDRGLDGAKAHAEAEMRRRGLL